MKINNWFEARQYDIEKVGGKNDQLLVMFSWNHFKVLVSEFRHFVVCNKESSEKGDIMDPFILMNDA